jgi:hypothetical protein
MQSKKLINNNMKQATKPIQRRRSNKPKQSTNLQVTPLAVPASFGTEIRGRRKKLEVSHIGPRDEYIGDVIGNTAAFNLNTSYSVNPGQVATFPWLSSTARNYDMYCFKSLKFIYMGKTSTATGGEVTMVFDPDPTDAAPLNDTQALDYDAKLSVPAWTMRSVLEIPKEDLKRLPKFLVRESVVASELTTFDVGTLHLIVGGNPAIAKIGQLYVEYEIDLYAPQLVATGPSPPKFTSEYTLLSTQSITTGVPTVLNFSTVLYNGLGLTSVAGVFSGLSGGFSIYAQQTINATTFTSGFIAILKNGVSICSAVYPAIQPTQTTINAFVVTQLVPTDTISVSVTLVGTVLSAQANPALSILIFAPA